MQISYRADSHYRLTGHGFESITVTGNVTSNQIYASAAPDSYSYSIVYRSSNGANLGGDTATHEYGSTHTIYAPQISGYSAPGAQDVSWNTDSKTITFTYTPLPVGSHTVRDNAWWWQEGGYGIKYSLNVSFYNRTETTVQATVTWTNTITPYTFYGFWQAFEVAIGNASTGAVRLAENSTWMYSANYARSVSQSATITISGLSAKTNSVYYSAVASSYPDTYNAGSFSGYLTIPTY